MQSIFCGGKVTINQALKAILGFNILLLLSAFLFSCSDWESFLFILAAIIYDGLLLSLLYVGRGVVKPVIQVLVFISIVWIVFRLSYLSYFFDTINFQYLFRFSALETVWTVLLTAVSTVALATGVVIAGNVNIKYYSVFPNNILMHYKPDRQFIVMYFVVVSIVSYARISIYGFSVEKTTFEILFFMLFSYDLVLIVLLSIFLAQMNSARDTFILLLLLLIYVVVRTISGSKGGIFNVIFYGAIIFMAVNPNFKISKKAMLSVVAVIPVSILLYFVGHMVRVMLYTSDTGVNMSYIVNNYDDNLEAVFGQLDIKGVFDQISRRLSMFDYLNVYFNADPSQDYLGFIYTLKMAWNTIWPGFISDSISFSDVGVFPANLFKASYGYGTYEEVLLNYHSDMLPLFGWLYLNMGAFSFLVLFMFGYFFSRAFMHLDFIRKRTTPVPIAIVIYLFTSIVFGMGLAADLQQLIFFVIMPYVVQVAFYLFYKSLYRYLIDNKMLLK